MSAVLEGFQEVVGASLRPDMLGGVYWIIALAVAALLLFSVLGFLYFLFFLVFPFTGWFKLSGTANVGAVGRVDPYQRSASLSYHSSVLRSPSSRSISGA